MSVDSLKTCDNISELTKKLNVHRRLLDTWRDKLNPPELEDNPPLISRDSTLREEVRHLKRMLEDKTLEENFFKGALKKIKT